MAQYEFIAVYIMASRRNGTLYTGVTSDLITRVRDHRQGRGSEFTAKHGCKTLVWWEQFGEMTSAIAFEKDVKRWRRAWKLRLIEERNPQWRDLFEDLLLPRSLRQD
jgi:putative endonuclease